MPIRLIVLTIFLAIQHWSLWSQQPDSTGQFFPDTLAAAKALDTLGPGVVVQDSLPEMPKKKGAIRRFFTDKYPNPKKALLLAIIPGGGQAYNRKWWKLPIVYGALGGMLYWEIDNLRQYRALRDNYLWAVDDDPNTNPVEYPYNQLDATSLKKYRDQFRRYTELTSLGLGLTYLASAADAFVDAHLHNFDVSDDLSLKIRPVVQTSAMGFASIGVGVSLQLGRPQPRLPFQP